MTAVSGVGIRSSVDDNNVDASKYWLDYFGLSESPFQATARFSMYYPLPQWQSVLSFFHKNCRGDESLCMVTGMLGSGKTTLLRQFLEHVDRNVMVCSIKADVSSSVNTLLDAMTEDFCLPVASGRTIQSRLNKYLSALDSDRTYVLVVDDSHDLPLDTLAALLHFCVAQKHKIKLRVMLFGELSLQGRIESLMNKRGKANKLKTFNLEPLNLEDTKQYLRHRFIKAGMTRETPFSVSDIARIHRLSGGLPGRINRVAQQTLIDMMKSDQRDDTSALTYRLSMDEDGFGLRWFAVALFVSMVSCSVWMFHGHINDHLMSPILAKKESMVHAAPVLAVNDMTRHTYVARQMGHTKNAVAMSDSVQADPWEIGRVIKAVSGAVAHSVAKEVAESALVAAAPSVHAVAHQIPNRARVIRSLARNRVSMIQSLRTGKGYALQLSAIQHYSGPPKGVTGTKWSRMILPVPVLANGKHWTLVLLGHFDTKAQAEQMLQRLPENLKQLKPWVRSADSIAKIVPNA